MKRWMRVMTSLVLICIIGIIGTSAQTQTVEELYQAGVVAYWRTDDDVAMTSFNRAIELNPEFAPAYAFRGALHRALNNMPCVHA
jgi:hypothetical protein